MTASKPDATPRVDAKAKELTHGHKWGERWNGLLFLARELERELSAANSRAVEAKEETLRIIRLLPLDCEHLHHSKHEYHNHGIPCPVEKRIADWLTQLEAK